MSARHPSLRLGPGLLWAAAAIGISHLVQATRAGALVGFGLCGVLLLALLLKYPFFEFGTRYAVATGDSLVEGYARIGRWALCTFTLLSLLTALVQVPAVVMFSAYLVAVATGSELSRASIGLLLYAACAGVLVWGRYALLDRVVKGVLVALAVSTLVAAGLALPRAQWSSLSLSPLPAVLLDELVPYAFVLALLGFMPAPLEASVMSSLWLRAKGRTSGRQLGLREAQLDFAIGYGGAGLLALAFVALGSEVMYDSGATFENDGKRFAMQLVDLYAARLGSWTRPLVTLAVLTTMLSTTLAVIDGFPRVLERCWTHWRRRGPPAPSAASGREDGRDDVGPAYWSCMAVLGVGAWGVIGRFEGSLTQLLDFVTIFSFLVAPVIGYLNLRAVCSDEVPEALRPGPLLKGLAGLGLAAVTALGGGFVLTRFT